MIFYNLFNFYKILNKSNEEKIPFKIFNFIINIITIIVPFIVYDELIIEIEKKIYDINSINIDENINFNKMYNEMITIIYNIMINKSNLQNISDINKINEIKNTINQYGNKFYEIKNNYIKNSFTTLNEETIIISSVFIVIYFIISFFSIYYIEKNL